MKKNYKMKDQCPACGSKNLLTLGLDQLCCDCEWENSFELVRLGYMDAPFASANHHLAPVEGEMVEVSSKDQITEKTA